MNSNPRLPKQGYPTNFRRYYDKRLQFRLNGDRKVIGKVAGYDHLMNITVEEAVEYIGKDGRDTRALNKAIIRGSSIINWECLDKVD